MNPASTLESILAAAQAAPVKSVPLDSATLLPVVLELRDNKRMSWKEISAWVKENSTLHRSANHWSAVYNKAMGIKKSTRKNKPKAAASPATVVAPPSTSPVEKVSPASPPVEAATQA